MLGLPLFNQAHRCIIDASIIVFSTLFINVVCILLLLHLVRGQFPHLWRSNWSVELHVISFLSLGSWNTSLIGTEAVQAWEQSWRCRAWSWIPCLHWKWRVVHLSLQLSSWCTCNVVVNTMRLVLTHSNYFIKDHSRLYGLELPEEMRKLWLNLYSRLISTIGSD